MRYDTRGKWLNNTVHSDGKRLVFRAFLNTLTEGERRIWVGREFQRRGPATQNALSPNDRRVRVTQRRLAFSERRPFLPEAYWMRKSVR